MRYIVQWRYVSGFGGPWKAGQVIEASEADAEIINRDSPGVLVADGAVVVPEPEPESDEIAAKDTDEESETRADDAPPHDRMVKTARRRNA